MNADTDNTPITDDPELAKVLADMNSPSKTAAPVADDTATTPLSVDGIATPDVPAPDVSPPLPPVAADPGYIATPVTPAAASSDPALETIKKDALEELKPLVGKLDLPADEKFDTLLLIIRSTDDKTLVQATYDAAKAIQDETKRAQALLDVIKEIDYFSTQTAA